MITFKQYLVEIAVQAQASAMAKKLLGVPNVISILDVKDDILMKAHEEKHKVIDTVGGAWIISLFTFLNKKFVRVDPPNGADAKQLYFIPKDENPLDFETPK